MTFPTNEDNQKIFFKFVNGIMKEIFSIYGNLLDELGNEFIDTLESQLKKSNKESYTTSETIKITSGKLSNLDKTIIKSEQTCNFYFYGRYYKSLMDQLNKGNDVNRNYIDITDKNICYNARKFNEFKNLIDCGYAEIKVRFEGKDYTIKTCYSMPTANLPELFNEAYSSYQNEFIDFMLSSIIRSVAGKEVDIEYEGGMGRRRRLQTEYTYDIEVENKYGRKITFSSSNEKSYIVKAQGVPGPVEELESESGNKSEFIGINLILLILFYIF
jgi:hypothetical protein